MNRSKYSQPLRLGEILVQKGWTTWKRISDALQIQRKTNERIGDILIQEGAVFPHQVARAHAIQLEKPFIDLSHFTFQPEVLSALPHSFILKQRVLPLSLTRNQIIVACSRPLRKSLMKQMCEMAQVLDVKMVIACPIALEMAIDQCYGHYQAAA